MPKSELNLDYEMVNQSNKLIHHHTENGQNQDEQQQQYQQEQIFKYNKNTKSISQKLKIFFIKKINGMYKYIQKNELCQNFSKEYLNKAFMMQVIHFFMTLALVYNFYIYHHKVRDYCGKSKWKRPEQCIGFLAEYTTKNMKFLSLGALIHCLSIYMSFIKKITSKFYGFASIIMFIYQTNYHYGQIDIDSITIRNHRTGIILGYIGFHFVAAFLIFSVNMFLKLLKSSKKTLIFIFIFSIFAYFYFKDLLYTSCEGWENGLVDSIQENDINCQVKRPEICYPNIIDNFFNLSTKMTCELDMSTQEKKRQLIIDALIKYQRMDPQEENEFLKSEELDTREVQKLTDEQIDDIIKDNKYIGWPRIQDNSIENRFNEYVLIEYLINNSTYYDNKDDALKGNHEVLIDVHNQEFIINVQRKEDIVEERKQKAQNVDSLANNVIFIYVDTVSRPQVYRKLKKTASFLKKYAQNQLKGEHETDTSVYEFFRFHSIQGNTFANVMKMQYDITKFEFEMGLKELNKKERKRSVFKNFQDAGYITSHGTNSLSINSALRNKKYKKKYYHKLFETTIFDHELYFFDPQYMQAGNTFGIKKGMNSLTRRCAYGHDTNYHVFNFGQQFLDQYKNDKKFLLLEFTDAHELTSEVVQYLDDNLYNFLINIERNGHLEKDTMLYFVSDHGQHLISAFQFLKNPTDVYTVERMLPFYYMLITKDLLNKYDNIQKNIKINQQNVISMHEIYNSLAVSAFGVNNQTNYDMYYEESVFNQLKGNRSCLDINMVDEKSDQYLFCSCTPQNMSYEEFNEKWEQQIENRIYTGEQNKLNNFFK